jgi:hypothetical protein
LEKELQKKERKEIISLVQEYRDVFSFTYDELKAYGKMYFNIQSPSRKTLILFVRNLDK